MYEIYGVVTVAGVHDKEEPYRDLALIYDGLIGEAAFDCWRENFKRLSLDCSIEFETAADIACGTGLAAHYLSGRCGRVYAVDNSPEMLEVARKRNYQAEVIFINQSFTELELPENVDFLTCNFDSLNYLLSEGELQEAFNRFARSIAPVGYAMFDMNTIKELERAIDETTLVHRVPGGVSIWETDWESDARISEVSMINFVKVDGDLYRVSEEVHRERCYDLDVVLEFIGHAGFSHAEAWDAKDLLLVSEGTRRVQFLAWK